MDAGTVEATLALRDQASSQLQGFLGSLGKMGPVLGGVATAAGLAGAAIAGTTALVAALGSRGADVNDVTEAFQRLSEASGGNAGANMRALQDGVDGLLTKFELMKPLNQAMSAGLKLNAEDAKTMAQAARVLADAQGKDLKTAYEQIAESMGKGKTRALENLGVTVEMKTATNALKDSLKAEGEEMSTATERATARKAIMQELRKVVADAGETELDFAEKLAMVQVKLSEFVDDLGAAIAKSPVLAAGMDAIGEAISAAFGGESEGLIKTIVEWIEEGAIFVMKLALAVVNFGDVGGRIFAAIGTVVGGLVTGISAIFEVIQNGIAYSLEAASKIPIIGENYEEAAAGARSAATAISEYRIKSAESTEELAKGVAGHGAYFDRLNQVKTGLNGAITAMEAAQGATAKETEEIDKATVAKGKYEAVTKTATEAEKKFIEEVKNLARQISGANLDREIELIEAALDELGETGTMTEYEFQQLGKRILELEQQGGRLSPRLEAIAQAQQRVNQRAAEANFVLKIEKDLVAATNLEWGKRVALGVPDALIEETILQNELNAALMSALGITQDMNDEARSDATAKKTKDMQDFIGTLDGVQGILHEIAQETEGAVQEIATFAAQAVGIVANLATGNWVGAIVQGIALIGMAVAKMRPEGAKVNDLRDDFIEASGGVEALEASLIRIGRPDLWDPLMAGPANIGAMEDAMEDIQIAIRDTDEAMKRYGFTMDDVGSEGERLARTSQRIAGDFKRLELAGFSVAQVTKKAADELNNLLLTAMDTGEKLPATLQPYLQELIRSGQLTDEVKRKMLGIADPAPWKEMEDAANRYGISIDALGLKFEQSKIDDNFEQIAKDWQLLATNGADINAVMSGMQDEVQELISKALTLGLTIPSSMRPLLEGMVNAGLLTDAAGKKLTDLKDVKFAQSIEEQFESLMGKMDELISKIIDELVPALGGIGGVPTGATAPRSPAVTGETGINEGDVTGTTSGATESDVNTSLRQRPGTAPIVVNNRIDIDGRAVARSTSRYTPELLEGAGL